LSQVNKLNKPVAELARMLLSDQQRNWTATEPIIGSFHLVQGRRVFSNPGVLSWMSWFLTQCISSC